jgi:uncharacterized RDD family membrane protein YckC
MKCPKCSYLGFETSDRCKNCGYDFSLLAARPEPVDADLTIHLADELPVRAATSWMDHQLHGRIDAVVEAHEMPEPVASGTSFPLFARTSEDDDEPLIRLPTAPRAPLAVRRTPEPARFRQEPRSARADDPGLSLEFAEEPFIAPLPPAYESLAPRARTVAQAEVAEVAGLLRRAVAGLTDHAILFGVDMIVVYCTLRLASLTMGDWPLLPPVPMLAFLILLKVAYFSAFTAACGQTIGKMAARIRVVANDGTLDPARAVRRTLMAAVSLLAFGSGFIPALLDPDRRALHDRVARTRVVELPSV